MLEGADREDSSATTVRGRVLELLLLAFAPACLLLPIVLRGEVFLPWLPTGLEPLASDHPDSARAAMDQANLAQGDRVFPVLTDQIAMRGELLDGHSPGWEPLFGLGAPLFAGSIAGIAYPPNWLAVLVAPEQAAAPLAFVSLFLAGLGMWLFLARLGLSLGPRLVGAIACQLGGFAVANLFYFMKVDAALWVPWSLWAIEGLAARKRWSGLWLAISLGFSLLAGFVTIAFFGVCLAGVYGLVRLGRGAIGEAAGGAGSRRATLARAALFFLLGLAIGAVQIVPSFEASRESLRVETSAADLATQTLPLAALVSTVVPDFAGAPTDAPETGALPIPWWITPTEDHGKAEHANSVEWNAYAGLAVVALALAAILSRARGSLFPALALAAVLFFACGVPPLSLLYGLPGFNVGAPVRVLALAWPLWAWLAALGLEALIAERAPASRAIGAFLATSAVLAIGIFVLWTRVEPERSAEALEDTLVERYSDLGETRESIRARLPRETSETAFARLDRSLGRALAAALCALAAGGAVHLLLAGSAATGGRAKNAARFAWAPLALVVFGEGISASRGHATGRAILGNLFPWSPSIDALREAAGDGRVLRLDRSASGVAEVAGLARPNMLEPYGIADLSGYIVFTPRRLVELCNELDPRTRYLKGVARLPDLELVDHPLLDLLRVTAIVSRDPVAHPRLTAVLERPGFNVYRRGGALPAARLVPTALASGSDAEALVSLASGAIDFARETVLAPEHGMEAESVAWTAASATPAVHVSRPAKGRMDVRISDSPGGWLVMHEQHYPGWRARVNGVDVPLLRTDHVYRAVRVPSGEVEVETRYAPRSLELGAALTFAALALATLVAWKRA